MKTMTRTRLLGMLGVLGILAGVWVVRALVRSSARRNSSQKSRKARDVRGLTDLASVTAALLPHA